MAKTAITPTREEDYSEWYQQVIKAADLAEHSAVRGCMVIKPWGYSLWENIQKVLDGKFKDTGHATKEEAVEETVRMLDVYHDFARDYLAIPVL